MSPLLAHQGGWDEILLPTLAVLAMIGLMRYRHRRSTTRRDAGGMDADGTCGYCGAELPSGVRRCPSCGFRVPAG